MKHQTQDSDHPQVMIEIPSSGETGPTIDKNQFGWRTVDTIFAWLPAAAAACGLVKLIMEIIRCFSEGIYKGQRIGEAKQFSLEFLPRYYEPILFWIAGITFGLVLLFFLVRFYRMAKTQKRVWFTVLLALALLIAAAFLLLWGLHDAPDMPLIDAFINAVGEDTLRGFFSANPWAAKPAFAAIPAGVSGLMLLIALCLLLFDEYSKNGFYFIIMLIWAAVIFLGIPILIFLLRNVYILIILGIVLFCAGVVALIVFIARRAQDGDTFSAEEYQKRPSAKKDRSAAKETSHPALQKESHTAEEAEELKELLSDEEFKGLQLDEEAFAESTTSYRWRIADLIAVWLPFINVILAVVFIIISLCRGYSNFDEFTRNYWHSVPSYISLAVIGVVSLYALVRFYRLASRGKKVTVSILLGVSVLAATPLWIYLILKLRYDVPGVQNTIGMAEGEALIAFIKGLGRVLSPVLAIALLAIAAILMLVAWGFIWFDRNGRLFVSAFGGALIYFAGGPILFLFIKTIIALVTAIAALAAAGIVIALIGCKSAREVVIEGIKQEISEHTKAAIKASKDAANSVINKSYYQRLSKDEFSKASEARKKLDRIR